jgi:hypothetical protein
LRSGRQWLWLWRVAPRPRSQPLCCAQL